jgi:hypothetical protein
MKILKAHTDIYGNWDFRLSLFLLCYSYDKDYHPS